MYQASPKRAYPFDLNDVRIAARKILGVKLLLPAVENELLLAVAGYQDRLRSLASASTAGGRFRHLALRRVETSPAARLVAFVLANGKRRRNDAARMTWEEIKAEAVRVNLRKPSGELVYCTERPKRSGETRWTCSFGSRARGAQRMVEHIIFMVAGPSRYEHARKGRGRETAIRETLDSIEQKGVRWFGLLDVKDFFPSVTREMVKEVLGFLPLAIIEATIFIHDETDTQLRPLYGDKDTNSSAFAIRKGIPQGSLVSTLVAGKVLERHFDKLAARHVVTHVDNVLIGGKDEEEVQAKVTALAASFEGQPSGSLRLTGEMKKLGDHTMNYLGYRFRRRSKRHGGFGRAVFSECSRHRFHGRIASKMLFANWRSWGQTIDEECARWVRSFPSWTTRLENEDAMAIEVHENLMPLVDAARAAISASKMRWASFQDLADFSAALSSRIGQAVPRLYTEGGPTDFERVSATHEPWERFEALIAQNSKKLVKAVG